MIVVDIPILTKTPNGSRGSWAAHAARRRRERQTVRACLSIHRPAALPVVVTLIRMSPRPLDDDNNVASFKSVRDEVALWLGVDDGPRETRVRWLYDQEHTHKVNGAPAQKGIRIVVATMPEEA